MKTKISKRILSILLCIMMVLAMVPMQTVFAVEATTPPLNDEGYYEISTVEHLKWFADMHAVEDPANINNAKLMADITINENVLNDDGTLNTDNTDYVSIGLIRYFYGTFDGNGHKISGIYSNMRANCNSFFRANYGVIKNLGIVDSYFYSDYDEMAATGAICGKTYGGEIINCYSSSTVLSTGYRVGGICGYATSASKIIDCYNTGNVYSSKNFGEYGEVGGIVGWLAYNSLVKGCYNEGTVSGDGRRTGGIAGENYHGTIEDCYNSGTVSSTRAYVGGICGDNYGYSSDTIIRNCYNTGTVSTADFDAGGISGRNGWQYALIENCCNFGSVTAVRTAGGISATNTGNEGKYATIRNCYNSGSVNCTTTSEAGGIACPNFGTIKNCYNTGEVTCAKDTPAPIYRYGGGDNIVENNYYLEGNYITRNGTEAKTAEQFASGEIAYLLNESANAGVFRQNLDNGNKADAFPVLDNSHGAVYFGYEDCYATESKYTNSKVNETQGHKFSEPTCVDVAACIYCGLKDELDPDNHITTDTYYKLIDDETHELLHSCCDGVISTEEHTPGNEATCTEQKYCTVCHSTYGETNGENHTGELVWYTTDYSHIKKWTCCSATEGVSQTHTPDFKVSEDGNTLSADCSVCGHFLGSASISFEDGVVYDGKEHSATMDGYIYCAYGDKSLRFTYWQNGERVDNRYDGGITKAGTYTVRLGTYDQTAYIEKDVTIQKRELTVNAIYVNNKVYDGNNEMTAYSASFNNVAEGEVLYSAVEGTLVVSDSKAGYYETVKGVEAVSVFASTIASYYGDNYYVTVDPETEYPVAGGCYINQCTLTVTAENQMITEGEAIDQSKFTLENLPEGYECSGITLETNDNDNVINVNTDDASVTYNGEDVTENFCFSTYSGILETVCQGHQFDEDGFCATRECGVYQTPEYTLDEYGTKTYIITNAGELYFYAQQVNVYLQNSDGAKLANDIEIPLTVSQGGSIPDWTPINDLYAEFDGQGHTVSGLYCKSDASYIGMFGYTGYYPIKNLIISDSYFEGTGTIGALAGYSQATISNCGVTDTVTVVGGDYYTGGFVGNNSSTIRDSFAMTSSFVYYSSESYGASTENCYYLAEEETDSYDGTIAKTAEAFASGEVAYLLQVGVQPEDIYDDEWNVIDTIIPEVWGQKIGTDTYPTLGGEKVYVVVNCIGEIVGYSNTENTDGGHCAFENGFCTGCGDFEPAKYNEAKDVYEISNAGQLYWFAQYVNAGNTSANAILTADIVVNEGTVTESSTDARAWTPIGNNSNKYAGTFDGNGKTVSGLYFNNSEAQYVGLFGVIGENGEVKNTGVINSYFNADKCVGGVAGYNFGTVTNCYNAAEISADKLVGGIVGCSYGIVANSYNTGKVNGNNCVSGVVGTSQTGTIINCYNTGEVSGTSNVGGILGESYSATIANCYNTGTVYGNYYFGAIFGYGRNYDASNCYYLDSSCSFGTGDDSVYGPITSKAKTSAEFASGEVAYLLQSEQIESVWGQTIGTDELPTIGGDKVYVITDSEGNITGYTNTVQTDKLAGHTISLGDKIAVNYYMSLTEKTLNDANAKMIFTVPDTGSTYTLEIPVSEAVKSGDYYVFTCEVAAKEMTSAISAKLITSESELQLDDYTVQEYAEDILANPETYAKEQELVKKMLNYGTEAQLYFNYNTDKLANNTEYMTEQEKTVELYGFAGAPYILEGTEAGVTYYGTALSLETELAFKHYFIIDESVDAQSLEITCDYPVTLKKNGNFYELIISDIPAHKMGEGSLKVSLGGITLDYTIYSYGALAQSAGNAELWTMVSALTHYANEAVSYLVKEN